MNSNTGAIAEGVGVLVVLVIIFAVLYYCGGGTRSGAARQGGKTIPPKKKSSGLSMETSDFNSSILTRSGSRANYVIDECDSLARVLPVSSWTKLAGSQAVHEGMERAAVFRLLVDLAQFRKLLESKLFRKFGSLAL